MLSSLSMDDMSSIISIEDDDEGIAVVNWRETSTSTSTPTPTCTPDSPSRNYSASTSNSNIASYEENATILSSQPSPSRHTQDHQSISLSTLPLNENEHFEWHMNMNMSTNSTERQNQEPMHAIKKNTDELNANERINEEHKDTIAPLLLPPTRTPTDVISSSLESVDSNLSLPLSDICSSISSLFYSETPDHEHEHENENEHFLAENLKWNQNLNQSLNRAESTHVSNECSNSSMPSVTSSSDSFFDGKHETEIIEETGSPFPSDAFLNIGGRLSMQDAIISAMPLPIYSLGGNSSPEDIHRSNFTIYGTDADIDTVTDTVTSMNTDTTRATEMDQWMDYTDQQWDEFADTAKKILHVLEGPVSRSTGKDLYQKMIPPPPPPMEESKSNGATYSEQQQHHHRRRHHLDADTAQQILRTFQPEFMCSFCNQLIVGATTLNCGCERASVCASCVDSKKLEDDSDVLRNAFTAQTAVLATAVENSDLMKDVKEGECFVVEPTIVSQFPDVKFAGASADKNGWKGVVSENQCGANLVCPSCHSFYDRRVPCHALDVAILDAVKNMTKHGTNANRMNIKLSDLNIFQSIFYMRLLLRRQEVIRHLASMRKKHDYDEQLRLGQLLHEQERAWRTVEMEKEKDDDSVLWVNIGIFVGFVFVGLRAFSKLR